MASSVSGSTTESSSSDGKSKKKPRYGAAGISMLESLKKSPWLPPFDNDKRRETLEQVNELYGLIKQVLETTGGQIKDTSVGCGLIIHHNAILRNKRILAAYVRHRMSVIEDLRWHKGVVIEDEHRSKLDNTEELYFKEYNALLSGFMIDMGLSDSLFTLMPPNMEEKDILLSEKVGNVTTEDGGSWRLDPGTRHNIDHVESEASLRRGDMMLPKN